MSMRLISEVTEDISTSIIEEAEGTKSTFIEGIFAQAEKRGKRDAECAGSHSAG